MKRTLVATSKAVLPEAVFASARLVLRYTRRSGKLPDLFAPKTFNEKMLYRLLFDRRPILTMLADKYAVREYVKERVGAHVLTDLYWTTKDPSDIPFDMLPRKFVVKPSHGSGWVRFVADKARVDPGELVETCAGWLRQNYYHVAAE